MRANTFLGIVVACVMTVPLVGQDNPYAPIDQLRTVLQAAYYRGDTAVLSQLFTDDAEIVIDRVSIAGPAQIRAFYRTRLVEGVLLVLAPTKMQLSGSLAVESGSCATRLATLRFGGTATQEDGRYVMSFVNIDGEWRISSLMIQNSVTMRPENTVDRPAIRLPAPGGV